MMRFLRKRDKGFTLLEVMLVVIIIGIIAIIALPKLLVTKGEAENKSCDSNVQAIRTQLEQFHWDNGNYPPGTSIATFLDTPGVYPGGYSKYWPETSAVSSNCPGDGTYKYTLSTGKLVCSDHSN